MARHYRVGEEPVPGYRLVKLLGRGGFGMVWKATAPGGAEAALKIITLTKEHGLKELRAIRLVKQIHHANLVPVNAIWLKDEDGQLLDNDSLGSSLNLGTQEMELLIAMGLGDKNLLDRLRECQKQGLAGIPRDELLDYMEQAARAIDFLNQPRHNLGSGPVAIQHCDIKPHNIIIVGDAAQVCDFGLARVLGDPRVTQAQWTNAYVAPEVITNKGNEPSRFTDQYCLAITYIELRTGSLPLESRNPSAMIYAIAQGNLDFSKVPEPELTVLRKATAVTPDQRFPSCADLVKALRRAEPGRQPVEAVSRPPINVNELIQPGSEVVPGYKLIRRLGKGGYGEVWEASAPGGKRVALKIIRDVGEVQGRQEFKALELIKGLDHSHLVELQAYWLLDRQGQVIPDDLRSRPQAPSASLLVIAMWLGQKSLLQRLHECQSEGHKGIPLEELLPYMRQTAKALDYLNGNHQLEVHHVSTQHRDIKPENILLGRDGNVRIGDFGLAKVVEGTEAIIHGDSMGLTLPYAAPEMIGGIVTSWTDQYSLALTYFKLRTGVMPFPTAGSPNALLRAHLYHEFDLSLLPPGERGVIDRATAVKPEARFPTCIEMVKGLEKSVAIEPDDPTLVPGPPGGPSLTPVVRTDRPTHTEQPAVSSSPPGPTVSGTVPHPGSSPGRKSGPRPVSTATAESGQPFSIPGPEETGTAKLSPETAEGISPVAPTVSAGWNNPDNTLAPDEQLERRPDLSEVPKRSSKEIEIARQRAEAEQIAQVRRLFASKEKLPEAAALLSKLSLTQRAKKVELEEELTNRWHQYAVEEYRAGLRPQAVRTCRALLEEFPQYAPAHALLKKALRRPRIKIVIQITVLVLVLALGGVLALYLPGAMLAGDVQKLLEAEKYREARAAIDGAVLVTSPAKQAQEDRVRSAWRAKAQKQFDKKQYEEAANTLDEMLDSFKDDDAAVELRRNALDGFVSEKVSQLCKGQQFAEACKVLMRPGLQDRLRRDQHARVGTDWVQVPWAYLDDRHYEQAQGEATKLLETIPDVPETRAARGQAREAQQIAEVGRLLADKDKLAEAAAKLQALDASLGKRKLQLEQELKATWLKYAKEDFKEKRYREAARTCRAMLKEFRDHQPAKDQLKEVQEAICTSIDNLITRGDFKAAIEGLRENRAELSQAQADRLRDNLVEAIAKQVEKYIASKDIDRATKMLKDFGNELPPVRKQALEAKLHTSPPPPPPDLAKLLARAASELKAGHWREGRATLKEAEVLLAQASSEDRMEYKALRCILLARAPVEPDDRSTAVTLFKELLPKEKPPYLREACQALTQLALDNPADYLEVVLEALEKAQPNHPLEVAKLPQELWSKKIERRVPGVTKDSNWAALLLDCARAEPNSAWVLAHKAECLIEKAKGKPSPEDLEQAHSAARRAVQLAQSDAVPYAQYVLALAEDASGNPLRAGESFVLAFAGDNPPPALRGRYRLERARVILEDAAHRLRNNSDSKTLFQPFKRDVADTAYQWLSKADRLSSVADRRLGNQAQMDLTLAAALKPNPENAQALKLSEELLKDFKEDEWNSDAAVLQWVKARCQPKGPEGEAAALKAYTDFLALYKKGEGDEVSPQALYKEVVEPAFAIAEKVQRGDVPELKNLKVPAAQVYAARGRLLGKYPHGKWLPFQSAKEALQAGLQSYTYAVDLDRRAEYLAGRAGAQTKLPEAGYLKKIAQDAEAAMAKDPSAPTGYGWRGYAYILEGRQVYKDKDFEGAAAVFEQAIQVLTEGIKRCDPAQRNSDLPALYLMRSQAHLWRANALPKLREKELESSKKDLDAATDPKFKSAAAGQAWSQRGIILEDKAYLRGEKTDYPHAIDAFDQAVLLAPGEVMPRLDRGRCRYKIVAFGSGDGADVKKAVGDLETALKREPNPEQEALINYWLGKAYALGYTYKDTKDSFPKADECFRRADKHLGDAVAIARNHQLKDIRLYREARVQIALDWADWLLHKDPKDTNGAKQHYDAALDCAKDLTADDPGEAALLSALARGRRLQLEGKAEQALKVYEKELPAEPGKYKAAFVRLSLARHQCLLDPDSQITPPQVNLTWKGLAKNAEDLVELADDSTMERTLLASALAVAGQANLNLALVDNEEGYRKTALSRLQRAVKVALPGQPGEWKWRLKLAEQLKIQIDDKETDAAERKKLRQLALGVLKEGQRWAPDKKFDALISELEQK
jgi:serine/threonine protein kinase